MAPRHNFENIRNSYQQLFEESIIKKKNFIHFYVEDWSSTLYEVPLKIYNDIRSIGTFLYPIYPIGEYFVDFGNPFKKVGIVILYKEYQRQESADCINYFENHGWTIYSIESKHVEPSAEELYRRENKNLINPYLYESEDMQDFIERHKDVNSECLIYHIKQKFFSDITRTSDNY